MPVLVKRFDECEKVMVTGSILNNDVKNAIVWGCGLAYSTDTVPEKKAILAVRGKLTGEILKRQKTPFDEVYGDPALLLPRLYDKPVHRLWKLGILPHYVDAKTVHDKINKGNHALAACGIKILDINSDVETVIDEIRSCERILSSSLHGIIAAHAYGVPCEWVKFSDQIGGDDFKYHDYFSSINCDKKLFIDLREEKLTKDNMIAWANFSNFLAPKIDNDLDALWNCCPFKQ